jgi:hypothetical protein
MAALCFEFVFLYEPVWSGVKHEVQGGPQGSGVALAHEKLIYIWEDQCYVHM